MKPVVNLRGVRCGWCGALPGQPCRRPSGQVIDEHAARRVAAILAGVTA